MHITRYDNLNDLARDAEQWETLAEGIPFRSWGWASTWWRHYGAVRQRRLYVVTVHDEAERLAGVLPLYLDVSATSGRTLRLLGSGEVCADYTGLLCRPGWEATLSDAIASWLAEQALGDASNANRWDLLWLENIDAEDRPSMLLAEHLAQAGCRVHQRPGTRCWRVALPASWAEYLRRLSKSHRKQVGRAESRLFATRRAVLRSVTCRDELPRTMDLLERLHQRRRLQLGQPGCFASERFAAFHRDVALTMLRAGQLQLHWLELDGRPVAVEYHLAGGGMVYAYQAGIEPEALTYEPGSLITQASLRRAIERGYLAFDFLRGDEPYKAHWRAEARPNWEICVAADRPGAWLRQSVWVAGTQVKRLLHGELSP
jgi:CelD/BcsL family acetyltransferase involved in cellulose biosynthesis